MRGRAGQQACDQGCPLQLQPVCSAEGITYVNHCTALCQGVTVASSGKCPGRWAGEPCLPRRPESTTLTARTSSRLMPPCSEAQPHPPGAGDALELLPAGLQKERWSAGDEGGAGRFSPEQLQLFAAEGFKLVGRVKSVPAVTPPQQVPAQG